MRGKVQRNCQDQVYRVSTLKTCKKFGARKHGCCKSVFEEGFQGRDAMVYLGAHIAKAQICDEGHLQRAQGASAAIPQSLG